MGNQEEGFDQGFLVYHVYAVDALAVQTAANALLEALAVGLLAASLALAALPVAHCLRLYFRGEDLGVLAEQFLMDLHHFFHVFLVVFTVPTFAFWGA